MYVCGYPQCCEPPFDTFEKFKEHVDRCHPKPAKKPVEFHDDSWGIDVDNERMRRAEQEEQDRAARSDSRHRSK